MQCRDAAVSYGSVRRILGMILLVAHSYKYRVIGVMDSVISWVLMVG